MSVKKAAEKFERAMSHYGPDLRWYEKPIVRRVEWIGHTGDSYSYFKSLSAIPLAGPMPDLKPEYFSWPSEIPHGPSGLIQLPGPEHKHLGIPFLPPVSGAPTPFPMPSLTMTLRYHGKAMGYSPTVTAAAIAATMDAIRARAKPPGPDEVLRIFDVCAEAIIKSGEAK